jgi:succinate dehydrogenase / fumarate reductase membrane anchor subunit
MYPELGAARPLRDWLVQRATALVMTAYTLLFLIILANLPEMNFSIWRRIFLPQPMKVATMLFLTCAFFHVWVGMRNIFMDYVQSAALRRNLYGITIGVLVIYAVWAAYILWKVL